ncbi:signal peptide, CUB and EGF-like domain-containing protein 1 [Petromyzon marinus]|uniref:signal peptide, CUB and EGF-like domain-containing protein 1 n=1 Tax=Petromyzon marinus TaxID=7757 RepID=UPI003F6F7EE5
MSLHWNLKDCVDVCARLSVRPSVMSNPRPLLHSSPNQHLHPACSTAASCVAVLHSAGHHGEACVLCPAVAKHPGQTLDVSDCGVPCPAGSVSPDGFEPCSPCPRGSYQAEAGRVACAPCRGRARRTRGARFGDCDARVLCPPGHYYEQSTSSSSSPSSTSPSSSSMHCHRCPRGSYQARSGQRWCSPCPQGSTTDSDGATSLTQCKGARCGGDLGDLVGELESPNHPGSYPVPASCQWLVTAPARHRLLLLLPEAELRPCDVACTDRLSVKASLSPQGRVWLELCSSRARPLLLNVPARRVWVDFSSSSGSTGIAAAEAEGATAAGFHMDYVAYHEEYEDLIQDIISDGHLYSFESHQQVLKNKKLVKTLFEVLANPHSYFKSTSQHAKNLFPKSFLRFLKSKISRYLHPL